MGLRTKFNAAFVAIFAVGLLLTAVVSYVTELQQAREQVIHDAEVLLAMALSTRSYTVNEVRPLLAGTETNEFLRQTVPSFAAQETFLTFNETFPEFTYREAALNPTAPRDLASSWEVDIIREFITNRDIESSVVIRQTDEGNTLYYARPIVIQDQGCLECHSTPDVAPPSMIAQYGSNGGFGWQMDEVIGAQIVSVPMAVPYQQAQATTLTLVGSLFSVFTLVLISVNVLLDRAFIQPIRELAQTADRFSKGELDVKEFDSQRQDEIGMLERATNRLRRSLEKAMQLSQRGE